MRGQVKLPAGRPAGAVSIHEAQVGDVFWAYARHYWREVRIVGKARTRVAVAFWIHDGGSLVKQLLQVWNLRRERPARQNGALRTPAPTLAECGLPEGGQ